MRIGLITSLLSSVAVHLERFQARREGKRAGRRFAQFLERTPWAQRRFRTSMMRVGTPLLKGKRLARTQKSCCPANLLVQPKGRKYEDGLCNCGQHTEDVVKLAMSLQREYQQKAPATVIPFSSFKGYTDTVNEPGVELIGI